MDQNRDHRSGDHEQAELNSAAYRNRLLTKLNCLIAVLEVAIAKVSRSIGMPGSNDQRLGRIRSNLENTLSICHRAKETLQRGIDGAELAATRPTRIERPERMSYRDYVELSSIDEYRKFKQMPPISADDLESIDVDDVIRKLLDE